MFKQFCPENWALVFLICGHIFGSTQAQACSCCGESGERIEYTSPLKPHEEKLLASFQPASDANVMSFGGALSNQFENEEFGLTFALDVQKQPTEWVFKLTNDQGLEGRLTFPLPNKTHYFLADPLPPPNNNDTPRDFKMYKEWKFTSKSVGSGLFARSNKDGQISELIFRGTGGRCLDRESFHSWLLVIKNLDSKIEITGQLE